MDKKYIIGIICIVVIAIVAVTMFMGGGISQNGYQVRITTDGAWAGNIGSMDSSAYEGNGDKVIDVTKVDSGIVKASIEKRSNDTGEMKVEILKDGNIVKEGSSTVPFTVVTVSYTE